MVSDTFLRVEFHLFSLLVLAVIMVSSSPKGKERGFTDLRLFRMIGWTLGIVIFSDAISWLSDGRPGELNRFLVYLSNTVYFSFHTIPLSVFLIYVDHMTRPDKPLRSSPVLWMAVWASVFCVIMVMSNAWTGWIFTADLNNTYMRGKAFPIFYSVNVILGLFPIAILIKRRRNISRKSLLTLIFYPFPPLFGGIVQFFNYGTTFLWPATVVSFLLVFINLQNRQIDTDYLTGAYNRHSLGEYLFSLTKRNHQHADFCGILIDLDWFKKINDTYGHKMGDQALIEASEILRASVRKNDFLARFGGDEFVIILEAASDEALEEVAERIRHTIAASNANAKRPYLLSVSMGMGRFSASGDRTTDVFLHRLDGLMYEDKARLNNPENE